jgi:hypothetical protein
MSDTREIGMELFVDLDDIKEFYDNRYSAVKKIIDSLNPSIYEDPYGLRLKLFKMISQSNSGEFACLHKNFELTKWKNTNGVIVFKNQCLDCGRIANQNGAKKYSTGHEFWFNKDAEEFSKNISYKTSEKISQLIDAKQNDHALKIKEHLDSDYKNYLNTPEWKSKRERVLIRDNYLCQGCLKNRAIDVHHLTYANIKDELFFQLISLCKDCHAKTHKDKKH